MEIETLQGQNLQSRVWGSRNEFGDDVCAFEYLYVGYVPCSSVSIQV